MAPRAYRIRIWLTGFDTARSAELREEIGRLMRRAGPTQLKAILRRVHDGERLAVYQTNSRSDAEIVATNLMRRGAEVEIEG